MKSTVSFIMTRSNGRSFQLSLASIWVSFAKWTSICLVILLIGSLGLNIKLGRYYAKTEQFNEGQETQSMVIDQLKSDVNALRLLVEDLVIKEEKIRQDLGSPKQRPLSQQRSIKKKQRWFNRGYPKMDHEAFITHQIASELQYLKVNTLGVERQMRRHSGRIKQYLSWFNETPSIWPVYGYVRSGYGWRVHPLKRTRQFHKGIDIPAWVGAPVQATADGRVEFSGWGGGYGWIVVLSHKFGYKTIYAHLSEIQVNSGRKVSKGQIIGKVGSSGLSTGPHLHYEIRHRRRALEPINYLDLDLFTAVSKLW